VVDADRVAREANALATRARRLTKLTAQLRAQTSAPVLATVLVEPGEGLTDRQLAALRLAVAGASEELVITVQVAANRAPAQTKETHNGSTH
jgi:hypothetical protein